jgi:hypothetical protein
MVQEGGAGIRYLLHMGKHKGPAPVARKGRHDSILLCLTSGCRQAKWKDMGGLSAKDKLLARSHTKPTRRRVRTRDLSSLGHPLTTPPNEA